MNDQLSREHLENMFVSVAEVSRRTGWSPYQVQVNMNKLHFKPIVLAGRPVWYRCDMEVAVAYVTKLAAAERARIVTVATAAQSTSAGA